MCQPSDIFLGLLAVLFPPLAVWIKAGICSCESLLSIVLTTLGWLPGLLHAWYVIASMPDESSTVVYYQVDDVEAGRRSAPRIPGPAGPRNLNNPHGYVAPPPQIGPRAPVRAPSAAANYGTIMDAGPAPASMEAQVAPALAAPSSSAAANAPVGEVPYQDEPAPSAPPPSYAQAVRGDNKVQK